MHRAVVLLPILTMLDICSLPAQAAPASAALTRQVFTAESSFAATMARRDLKAFAAHVSPEAVFFSDTAALRGKEAVLEAWQGFFAGQKAPFSWRPETVEVLSSGTLALTSGPVHDPGGKLIGSFTSIWRRQADGSWRIIFDKGCPPPPASR
jgi:ketosteroid isomerase-like protein